MKRWFEDNNAQEPMPEVKKALEELMEKAKDEPYRSPKRIEIGALLLPWYFPDLDEVEIKKAILREVERQIKEYHESIGKKK